MGGNGWATGDFYFPQFIFKLVLNLRTHLAIPRRGFDGCNGGEGAIGIWGDKPASPPTSYNVQGSLPPHDRESPSQHVLSTEVKKP